MSPPVSLSSEPQEIDILRERLREAEEIIHAIRLGEIDAIVSRNEVMTLKNQEDPYRALVEGMREGALTLGLDGTILFANPVFATMLEIPLEQIVGSDIGAHVPESFHPQLEELLSMARVQKACAEIELNRNGGARLAVHIAAYPLMLDQVQGVSAIVTDLTMQRKLADRSAEIEIEREARVKIGTILEGITDCYLLLDSELRVLDVNRRALILIFNRSREAVMNKLLRTLDPENGFAELEGKINSIMAGGDQGHFEIAIGVYQRWFEAHAYSFGDRALVYMRDIDDRKRAESALLTLNETLEQRIRLATREVEHRAQQLQALTRQLINAEQRERRKIATDMHDYLAQILVVCKLKLAKLDKYLDDVEAAQIFEETNRFVDQALTYTRTLIAELSPTALQRAGLLAGLEVLTDKLKQLGLSVELQCEGPTGELPENEAILLYQSIRELLLNVVKHAGVEKAAVYCKWRPKGLCIEIRDHGCGFDLAKTHQAPSAEGKFGLLSVRERIEAIGGQFQVQSAPSQGTAVTIELPLKVPKGQGKGAGASEASSQFIAVGDEAATPNYISVLLVDDHRMVREGLRSVIDGTADLRVIGEANNGEEAVQLERSLEPDVVVMDVNMPRLNGIEATRRIRQRSAHTVVIGLSIFDEDDVSQVMKQAGAAALMGKSRAADELCDLIREHVAASMEAHGPVPVR